MGAKALATRGKKTGPSEGERQSRSFQLKQYLPEATLAIILDYLDRFDLLPSLGVDRVDVSDLVTEIVKQLADVGDTLRLSKRAVLAWGSSWVSPLTIASAEPIH